MPLRVAPGKPVQAGKVVKRKEESSSREEATGGDLLLVLLDHLSLHVCPQQIPLALLCIHITCKLGASSDSSLGAGLLLAKNVQRLAIQPCQVLLRSLLG